MIDILFVLYVLVFDIVTILNIYVLIQVLKQLKIQNKQTLVTNNKRIHSKIKTPDYTNSFGNRAYDIYKDKKTGLYEPQKPHRGIELKKQKEE